MTSYARRTAPFVRETLKLPRALTGRLDVLANEARAALGCQVPRAAVLRSALVWWLDDANDLSPEVLIAQLREGLPQVNGDQAQHPVYWPPELTARIDRRALEASFAFACQVPRAAVVRAALTAWLADALTRPREVVIQDIRAGMVKGGRRSR